MKFRLAAAAFLLLSLGPLTVVHSDESDDPRAFTRDPANGGCSCQPNPGRRSAAQGPRGETPESPEGPEAPGATPADG